jgi:WD40 repeat protein
MVSDELLVDMVTPNSIIFLSTRYMHIFLTGKINSIQIHPMHEHILVTASSGMNGFIAVHDIRKVGNGSKPWMPLFTLDRHTKSINAAYLSPGKGEYLVSVSLDNTVKIWKDIMQNSKTPVFTSFNHDNHTGRWLSTLKPSFDPNVDHSSFSSFVLGSMVKPRRMEVYTLTTSADVSVNNPVINLSGEFLGSVCSRNCFHPSRKGVIAGGNSSGKVHVFR